MQPTRRFGQFSLDGLLGAAGVKLVVVEDAEALDRVRNRLTPLERVDTRAAPKRKIVIKLTRQFMAEIGRLGGLKSNANRIRKQQRSVINRANALKRWRQARSTDAAA